MAKSDLTPPSQSLKSLPSLHHFNDIGYSEAPKFFMVDCEGIAGEIGYELYELLASVSKRASPGFQY